MTRTRDLYRAQGYTQDYRWAHFEDAPFSELTKPLSECRVTVITTAMPDTETGRSVRQVYSSDCQPIPQSLFTEELSWDKQATHTRDVASFVPLEQLNKLKDSGRIGSIAKQFHSVPTDYSQRNTIENDGPDILKRCQEENVDIALLVPL
jgi:D-proline reductase (dithiol) PrdB